MPFHYILNDLIAGVEGATAVVFLDEEGEAVGVVSRDFEPAAVRLAGAYLGIALRRMGAMLEAAGLGPPSTIQMVQGPHNLYLSTLPQGYFLVLVQRRPALAARARRRLERAADDLSRALFSI